MGDIDEVKARTNILDVIGARVQLKKAGHHFKALCPFHGEKTPSFIVSPERQIWKCFGCGKGGSVIDFVMEYEHVDFVEALETLAEKAGVKLERKQGDTPEGKLKQKIYEANHLASEFYHYLLTKHTLGEKARLYLKNRGISDKSIKTFSLGYSPNSWDGLLKFLRKKGYDENLLDRAGLIVPSSRGGYDRFRGRVMFTLKDHRGNVVGFSGRLLDPDANDPSASSGLGPKYINTNETPVYVKSTVLFGLDVTKAEIQKENEAIIMEGEFDVISSFQAGIGNAVAIKGSALTEGHVNLLKRFTDRILFALDSDVAGDSASRRGIEIADHAGLDMRVIMLPSGKDPDEAARENPGLLKKAIQQAIPIYDFFITSAVKRYGTDTSYGKKKMSEELVPILSTIENTIVQNHYIKTLAKTLDTSEGSILDALEKVKKEKSRGYVGKVRTNKTDTTSGDPQSRIDRLELYLVALLLQGKPHDQFEELIERISIADITNIAVRSILERLQKYLTQERIFLVKDFADSLPAELVPMLDEAFLWDLEGIAGDEELLSREWQKALVEYRRLGIRKKIQMLSKKEKEEGIDAELSRLSSELKDLDKSV